MPESRTEAEARAERSIRRGELREALDVYQGLLAQFPGDAAIAGRLASIQGLLQPAELMNPKANPRPPAPRQALSPEQEGEALYEVGDYAGAARAYAMALELRPDNELAQERYRELQTLLGVPETGPTAPPLPDELPRDKEGLCQALLSRIERRRRR